MAATTSHNQFNRLYSVLKPPPEEQVFGNPLLRHLILQNLGTQDNLRAALVNREWWATSRDLFKSKNSRIPMCVRVKSDSPCRKLAELNEFLKNAASSKDLTIVFNGIHYFPNDASYENYCRNCLFSHTRSYDDDEEVVQLYGQILESIKINYIWLKDCNQLDYNCASTKFVNFLLRDKTEDIVELNFSDYRFVELSLRNRRHMRLFPNLKVLGMGIDRYYIYGRSGTKFPIGVPSLKRITHFVFNPLRHYRHSVTKDFPHQAVTILGDYVDGMSLNSQSAKAALEFVTKFQPKIDRLYFEDCNREGVESIYSKEHRGDLFEFGRLISSDLKILKCSTLAFASLTRLDEENLFEDTRHHLRNCFSSLETLKLDGSVGAHFMDWLNGVDFYKDFPKLREVEINFCQPRYTIDGLVLGPVNWVSECVFKGVENLTLRGSRDFLRTTRSFLQLFSNIRSLNLINLVLKCDSMDHIFTSIRTGMNNLPFLEEIYFDPNISSLSKLNLDYLFQWDDLENEAVAANGKTRTVGTPLVLALTKLRKINISHPMGCISFTNKPPEETDVEPDRFVVSTRTAKWIKKHRPGFMISLMINKHCVLECNCPLPSICLTFCEHLTLLAISTVFQRGPASYDYQLHLKF